LIGRVSWGIFFIGVGLIWLTKDYHQLDVWALSMMLGGCILIVANATKAFLRVRISSGSLGIGVVLLLIGYAMLQGIKVNYFGLLLLLIGAILVLDALSRRR
jgi:hypothetical protein